MQCVILAGGLATRLRPLTDNLPKSLVPVGSHPFISYQLDWLAKHGVDEVVLSVGYLGSQVEDFVGSGARWNLRVRYVHEGTNLLGTGGALRLAFNKNTLAEKFLVTYGDSFLPVDFSKVFQAFESQEKPALMTVFHNRGKWDPSNVWFEAGQIRLYDKAGRNPESREKLQFIDYGLLAMERSVIEKNIPAGVKTDLSDVLYSLSVSGRLSGFEVKERFYETGSFTGLAEFTTYAQTQLPSPPL